MMHDVSPDLPREIAAKIETDFSRQTLMATLGGRLVSIAPGHCVMTAPISAGARQQHGHGHAGLTFALADNAAGFAALSVMPPGSEVLSVEMKINLLAPAKGPDLRATARVVRAGRRIVVVEAEVVSVEGETEKRIAAVLGTMIPA